MKIACPHCGKLFTKPGIHTHVARAHGSPEEKAKYSNGHNGKYNDPAHKKKLRDLLLKRYNVVDETRNCKNCDKEFVVLNSDVKKFCSISCSAKFHMRRRYGEPKPLPPKKIKPIYKIETRICIICKLKFQADERNLKVSCSKICARRNPNCGGKRNSKTFRYKGVTLDSTYELALAKSLDYHGIAWIRPTFFKYFIGNKLKRYHPDFYLPAYDVYLDPKNDYLIKIDKNKIKLVEEQNNIIVIVLDKEQLLWRHALPVINQRLRGDRGC